MGIAKKSITVPDIFLIIAYTILILVYAQHLTTRQNIAAVVGYTILLIAKRFEFENGKKDPITIRLKQVGYSALLLSPSFTNWYDAFAIIGYLFCLAGHFDESSTPLAIYYVMGGQHTTSMLSKSAKALLAFALSMGYKSPLN